MSQNKKPKGLLIVLITEIVLIVIGAVALIIVLISRGKSNTADNPSVQEEKEIAQVRVRNGWPLLPGYPGEDCPGHDLHSGRNQDDHRRDRF